MMPLCTVIFKSMSWRYSCRMIELFIFFSLNPLWKVQRQMYMPQSKAKTLLSFLGSALTMSFIFCILILQYLRALLTLDGLPFPRLANSCRAQRVYFSNENHPIQSSHPNHLCYWLSLLEPLSTCPNHHKQAQLLCPRAC